MAANGSSTSAVCHVPAGFTTARQNSNLSRFSPSTSVADVRLFRPVQRQLQLPSFENKYPGVLGRRRQNRAAAPTTSLVKSNQ